ncbi:hypothetical protein LTR84_010368 [Exophiala bonariae]|uniref:AB hydrolase-1 domain-containing protein n=1 Tax=Exophiala bonariae TaxID=1690606 RepID=A0AAV9MT63_9EURO|nr:hypothetical protein LTR84_010368 [Exophiala bonariae]
MVKAMFSTFTKLVPLLLLSLGASPPTVAAQDLSATTCTGLCASLVTNSSTWEASQKVTTDYAFYDVPSNFSKSLKPGTLLKVEYVTNYTNYTVPSGLTMSRILYTTSDLNGTTLPTSAYILWPFAPFQSPQLKDGQFPFVAWAHGTSGFQKTCAPSSYKSLQYHFMVPYKLALEGMVVVAPDYLGLGVDKLPTGEHIGHPYLAGPSVAADIAYAVTAARAAFPVQLPKDGPFVGMGHSQGGGSIWAFTERLVDHPLPGYKGSVMLAPAVQYFALLAKQLAALPEILSTAALTLQPAFVAAVTTAFPAYNYSGFTALGYDRYKNVVEPLKVCLPTYTLATSTEDVIFNTTKPGWYQDPTVQRYAEFTEHGHRKLKGPILMLAGERDAAVHYPSLLEIVNGTCSLLTQEKWGESIDFVTYKDMDHFPMIQASSARWLSWIKDRLAGKPAPKPGCSSAVVKGFRSEFTEQSTAPNFFLDAIPPSAPYQAAF